MPLSADQLFSIAPTFFQENGLTRLIAQNPTEILQIEMQRERAKRDGSAEYIGGTINQIARELEWRPGDFPEARCQH